MVILNHAFTKKTQKTPAREINITEKRKEQNPKFWTGYDKRLETFKLGVLLKQARQDAGLTQEQVAGKLKTTKSVISRMENHATDIKLSTLEKFAASLGRKIHVALE